MSECLVVVEVSQKQAYIFSSNKLRDNIYRSDVIAYVTGDAYFREAAAAYYDREKNEVYCGGGHAILQFESRKQARSFVRAVTLDARIRFAGLELFATICECEGEPTAEDLLFLLQKLEQKKAIRRASFAQGSFGVEAIDPATRAVEKPGIEIETDGRKKGASGFTKDYREYPKPTPGFTKDYRENPKSAPYLRSKGGTQADTPGIGRFSRDAFLPGFAKAWEFENLGGTKAESSFIAVVHVDGNAMGKRVEQIRGRNTADSWSWTEYRRMLKAFSDSVDQDFKSAFAEMCEAVAGDIRDGRLGEIELKKAPNGEFYFPVRRVITEGDDICFVTEGRIGIECARVFMEILSGKKNRVDGKGYAAAAGVVLVHHKYPFYIACKHAEMLCLNAKKYIANSTLNVEGADSSNVSAIDWHIDFGELEEDVEDIRRKYRTADGGRMELRPYVVCGPEPYRKAERARGYGNFRKLVMSFSETALVSGKLPSGEASCDIPQPYFLSDARKLSFDEAAYARGKIKQLREYIRQGETAVQNYLRANRIEELVLECFQGIYADPDLSLIGTGQKQQRETFLETSDGERRSILFDAIELMDEFIALSYTKEG